MREDDAILVQEYKDNVNFAQEGWHKRYYEQKFSCKTDDQVKETQTKIR
jgi:5'-3' exonuclease